MRRKSVQSLETIIAPIWVPCRSERNGEALATVNCYLAPFANIPSNRRGSEFELGDALNEPWDAGFPQFNSTPDKSDSGFCYFGVRYCSTVKDQCKIFFFVLCAHVF